MRIPVLLAAVAALLAAACSPDAAAPTPGNGQREAAEAAPPQANLATVADGSAAAVRAAAAEAPTPKAAAATTGPARRCGWLSNPTPGNWWLTDREDQWILATQGSEPVAGMDETPDMSTAGWVETNGHYGYGCACMTITANAEGRVTQIADAQPKPLKQCRADRKLPKPE